MRRALVVLAAAIALAACATAERPEGIVERWLLSLNQGAAGDPDVYAPRAVSDRVVPGWDELDPGVLDEIEVGRAAPGGGGRTIVPFRIVHVGGTGLVSVAVVEGARVITADRIAGAPPLPSRGGPGLARGAGVGWLAAVAVAGLLILATIGLMRLAPEPQTGSSR
jgi:hypothetical protein